MLELDHLAVSAGTLDEGVAWLEDALGVALAGGGKHALMATHNRLLGLGPSDYLEVIAIDPEAPPPGRPRWFRLDAFAGPPRLTNWILRTDDLGAALARAPEGIGRALDLARGDFRWRMGVPDDGCLPFDDAHPALIQWLGGGLKPQDRLCESGCRLARLEVAHPEAALLRRFLPLRDDRIVILPGERALRATFATPSGPRSLQ